MDGAMPAQRIRDLLTGGVRRSERGAHRFTPDDFARIQADTALAPCGDAAAGAARHTLAGVDPRDTPALDRLRQWNFDVPRRDERGIRDVPGYGSSGSRRCSSATISISCDQRPRITGKFSFVSRFLIDTLNGHADNAWCDDTRTPRRETRRRRRHRAAARVEDLQRRLGSDMTRWRWDAVHHRDRFPHALDSVGALRPLLSRSMGIGGDWSTVNVGASAADHHA